MLSVCLYYINLIIQHIMKKAKRIEYLEEDAKVKALKSAAELQGLSVGQFIRFYINPIVRKILNKGN